ncbi:MAG TPA: CoA-binding protein [Gaiellaceae bacterium]
MRAETYTDIRPVYSQTKTIAVVGASSDPEKPAHAVPAYLQSQGYRIVPVNPRVTELFGERGYPSLADVDLEVDLVEVFRPPGETPEIAAAAVALGASTLWLQLGIVSEEAAEIGDAGGLTVVMDRCMGIMHGELGLGPGIHPWLWEHPHYDEEG